MRSSFSGPWALLRLAALVVALPLVIGLAVLGFAWPAGRIAPRQLHVGVVGSSAATEAVIAHLRQGEPGAFDFRTYPSQTAARKAIRDRDVYGAIGVAGGRVEVLEASAASPAVAQLLSTAGEAAAAGLSRNSAASVSGTPRVVDVIAEPSGDPRGVVLSASLLPLTICSIIMASAIALVARLRPAWRQVSSLGVVAAACGLTAYVVAQGFLGALPGEHVATWAGFSLTILAIAASTAGLIALVGSAGLGISAVLFVFLGNPFSGVTSAPDLLPSGVRDIGQWLPPGAGANLLRSTAYFDGNGAKSHLAVLVAWTVFGLVAVVIGHHTSPRFAAYAAMKRESGQLTQRERGYFSRVQPPCIVRPSQSWKL
jgi:hypothetical protein